VAGKFSDLCLNAVPGLGLTDSSLAH